jgi:hypothetical protein
LKYDFVLPPELKEFKTCLAFTRGAVLKRRDTAGPVVVCKEDESIELSGEERKLLERGPTLCLIRGCKQEEMLVDTEMALLKHKWDLLNN